MAELLSHPSKTLLAKIAGVKPCNVTRCFREDPRIGQLFEMAGNVEDLMCFGR